MRKIICTILLMMVLSCEHETCPGADPDEPLVFKNCRFGSGHFGFWKIDPFGLPAYEYTLPHETSPESLWWNSERKMRRDHWHQIGNFRFSAFGNNGGYIEVFTEEGGFKWLNRFDRASANYGGGFAFIEENGERWSTAYIFKPEGAKTKRTFGIGYFYTETEHDGIKVKRRTFAPYGDDPVLISDVIIENETEKPREFFYYEYWDINVHHMLPVLISSGMLLKDIPEKNEEFRKKFNRFFMQGVEIDDTPGAGIVKTWLDASSTQPWIHGEDGAREADTAFRVFLIPLDGERGEGFIFRQEEFLKAIENTHVYSKNAEIPDDLKKISEINQPLALIHKRKVKIPPRNSVKLRYGYGYIPDESDLEFVQKYREENAFENTLQQWKDALVYFAPEKDSFLQREIAWHSYYLQSGAYWREYTKTHIISQGGEYLFGHGFDGATRDYCIFSVPLIYINPSLSREILKFVMMTTLPDGEMAYANYGDTVLTGGFFLSRPSDLDIFFLWAISEYLLATKDFEFLKEKVPFYSDKGLFSDSVTTTVLDHIEVAFKHLVNTVGTGEHGLIRLRTGDWNDGIRWFTENPVLAEEKGESCFNTAFASAILPLSAEAITEADPPLAEEMIKKTEEFKKAMRSQWTGKWYLRGWQGNGKPIGEDRIFLEPQAWAIIAGIPSDEETQILIESIGEFLEKNSPLGARILYPPQYALPALPAGTDINGGIWPAINSILTWAYSLIDKLMAWNTFKRNTLAFHAEAYPHLWYGIWSGPDSYNSPESERPGEAACHYITALTDHPLPNMNQHAAPLLSLIKIAGIFPHRKGISIIPKIPLKRWSLNLPLIGITYGENEISGYYTPLVNGKISFQIWIPPEFHRKNLSLTLNNLQAPFELKNEMVSFVTEIFKDKTIKWKITGR